MLNSKRAEMSKFAWAILAIVGYMAYSQGLIPGFTPAASTGGTPTTGSSGSTGTTNTLNIASDCTQGTTLTGNILRLYTDALLTSENTTVYVDGAELKTIGNGGTTTVQSGKNGQTLELYPALYSTTYYANHFKGQLATCTAGASTADSQFTVVKDDSPGGAGVSVAQVSNKVYFIADNVGVTITNDGQSNAQDGTGNIGSAGGFENLSISQGSSGSVQMQFKVDFNEAYGPIGGNIIACQFPSAIYDATNPISITVAGQTLSASDKNPSSQQFVLYQANNTVKSFKFPGIDGRATPIVPGSVVLKADQNHKPASFIDRVNCTVFDTDYYKRQVDGKWVVDIENKDTNADLGGANSIFDFVIGVE